VKQSRGNGDKTGVRRGNVTLPNVDEGLTTSAGHDGPVSLEAQTVVRACGDGDEAGVGRGKANPSPRHDGAIGLEAQTVTIACGDGDERGIWRGNVALTVLIVTSTSPCHDGAVGFEP
jgi:hypothetical protein